MIGYAGEVNAGDNDEGGPYLVPLEEDIIPAFIKKSIQAPKGYICEVDEIGRDDMERSIILRVKWTQVVYTD